MAARTISPPLKRTVVVIEESVLDRLRAIKKTESVSVCETVRRAINEHLARRDARAKAIQNRRAGR